MINLVTESSLNIIGLILVIGRHSKWNCELALLIWS